MFFDPGRLKAIGFIRKAHGFDGAIKLIVEDQETIHKEEPVFLKPGGKPVPFFISQIRGEHPDHVVMLDDVGPDDIKRYQGMTVYQVRDEIADTETELLGYTIYDKDQPIGKVTGLLDRKIQSLIEVEYQGNSILLPLDEDLILEVDHKAKVIRMDLPKGLLDL